MGRMTASVVAERDRQKAAASFPNRVENFMGGRSYTLGALDTLKLVTASSIFGEPQYYRDGEFSDMKAKDGAYGVHEVFMEYAALSMDRYGGLSTSAVMERAIDDALDEDFGGTLEWARTLRSDFNMRLNPQIIMVRAAMHPGRTAFTRDNPSAFAVVNAEVMARGDDVINQLTYYLFLQKNKNTIPGVLKRSWAKKVESLSRYELFKYRNHGIGLIDTVRICHANNDGINELMKTGMVAVRDDQRTWESLRASGMAWTDIVRQIKLPHMALLRNLRGIFSETDDLELCDRLMAELADGVPYGRQFPFRYMSARTAVLGGGDVHHKARIVDGLEACMDKACANLPRLRGRSAFLSDNSGSAWNTCNSEYGSVKVAEIDNLSSVIGAVNSDEGWVFPFGDRLLSYEVSRRDGILSQADAISKEAGRRVGGGTECGVWLFFEKAIRDREHWDNIFIYSDCQAGHGELYGTEDGMGRYKAAGYRVVQGYQDYIDVAMLVAAYRKTVNPKVNVFCIQTAGYTDVLVPENGYRTSILYGWTGRELVYADCINRFWDGVDAGCVEPKAIGGKGA